MCRNVNIPRVLWYSKKMGFRSFSSIISQRSHFVTEKVLREDIHEKVLFCCVSLYELVYLLLSPRSLPLLLLNGKDSKAHWSDIRVSQNHENYTKIELYKEYPEISRRRLTRECLQFTDQCIFRSDCFLEQENILQQSVTPPSLVLAVFTILWHKKMYAKIYCRRCCLECWGDSVVSIIMMTTTTIMKTSRERQQNCTRCIKKGAVDWSLSRWLLWRRMWDLLCWWWFTSFWSIKRRSRFRQSLRERQLNLCVTESCEKSAWLYCFKMSLDLDHFLSFQESAVHRYLRT